MKEFLFKIGGALVVIAVILAFVGGKDFGAAFSEPVDINVDFPDDYYDVKAVETELYQLDDYFAEEEITNNGSKSYYYYYIVPVFTADDDEAYYVGVKVSKKNKSAYDKVVDSTQAFYYYGEGNLEESVKFTGALQKMEDDLYDYFLDAFEGSYDSEAQMKERVLPLVLEPMVFKNVRIMLFVIIGMLVAGGLMLFFALRPARQVAAASRPFITINGVNYPSSNFESVNKMVKKGETATAVKELQRLTGVEPEVAASVVSSWAQHWGN